MTAAISLRNLCKSFGDAEIIHDLDLDVQSNEFVTLLGSSGCGKTTLLGLIAQLDTPTSGSLTFSKNNVRVYQMFQEYGLFPWRTCIQNVVLALNHHDISKELKIEQARSWLSQLGMDGHEQKYPKQLSGGMKQRVALAQALATESPILLMDEPFGALDSMMREGLQDLIQSIWLKHKKTIIFVTHNIREAVFLGNRMVILGSLGDILLDIPTPVVTDKLDHKLIDIEKDVRSLLVKHQEQP